MAKADSDKEVHLNGDEAVAEGSEGAVDSALAPSTSSEQKNPASSDNAEIKEEAELKRPASTFSEDSEPEQFQGFDNAEIKEEGGVKRKASFSEDESEPEQFQGFGKDCIFDESAADMSKLIENMENDLSKAILSVTPVKQVTAVQNHNKRLRRETDGSRPSSALSTKSDSDGFGSNPELNPTSSSNRGRKNPVELSSPLFRVPLENGWVRELVYRATLDHHSRKQADIYYYTPAGKKLRSSREVSEHLAGTGLTLENFTFFKEPLGIDDPAKEIIRGAKLLRRSDTPAAATPAPVVVEGKRTPKPKAPKGVSPEAVKTSTPISKIKVKSFGSRLSGNTSTPNLTPTVASKRRRSPPPTPSTVQDNNNTTAKKPRLQSPPDSGLLTPAEVARAQSLASLASPPHPCSMSCGRARGTVPTLSCASCLCLYHPACVELRGDQDPNNFFCKNCRVTNSPPESESSPRSGTPPEAARLNERVTIRMKMSGQGPGGAKQWSVRGAVPGPQGVAKINGRQYIVVARTGQY